MQNVLRHRGLATPYRLSFQSHAVRPIALRPLAGVRWNSTSLDKQPGRTPPPPVATPGAQREPSKSRLTDPAPRPAPVQASTPQPPPPPQAGLNGSPAYAPGTTPSTSPTKPISSVEAKEQLADEHVSKEIADHKADKPSKELAEPNKPLLARAWAWLKHEANHYWSGTKLLGKEIRISARLVSKVLGGTKLTRREHRQLKRTTNDLLRLIPFSVFVIVPFMEFLLPVALKLFPNMLPSTFEDKFAAEEKARKLLRVRIEMAKFLQDTLRETGVKGAAKIADSEEFKEFFRKVRSTGEEPTREDVIHVAKLFNDDLTLDNLSRPQLVSMCRYMNVNAFGTDNFLRYVIRQRLGSIKRDDQLIDDEGVDSLSTKELQEACRSRGVRTIGISPATLREDLNQWIELHLTNNISGTLLILSRAFAMGEKGDDVVKSLEATLASMPDHLLNEAELDVSGDRGSYQQKLEVLQQQEELIEDEAEQEQEEEDARRKKRELEERTKREKEAQMAQSMLPESELVEEEDARMTTEQLSELGEALSILSAQSSVLKERAELQALMKEHEITEVPEDPSTLSSEDRASLSLAKRIKGMLKKIDAQLTEYDTKVGNSLQLISCTSQGMISINDLKQALRVIKHHPDEETIEGLVGKLDVDKDGFVVLEHVLELARGESLGIVVDEHAKDLMKEGKELVADKPRKEDIVQE
ncbi:LETM1-domain-containing protein [Dacryopinax primogenitus]|uniref:Mitochondrial proton/calcium exchanger protein n=1 Tax=Dacryopinax primogenitus (strain DJM 731) TaxID=1858805 RepID=M5FUA1_DACPD|nr:LETM1-domain-containing protein [Dacryopinax primogenitus]EJT96811.1 LETM1-domain-containing protein [Dacryopinax primogenitus]